MRALRRLLILAATAVAAFVLALDVLSVVGWPSGGPLALAQVFAEHLTLVALVVIPVAFLREARLLRGLLLVLALVTLARFGGEWWSWPSGVPDDAASLEVMTWNLEIDSRPPADAVAFLRQSTAGVIALQELTPDVSAAIAADPALALRYPYQALYPDPSVFGLGLLSRDPLASVRFDPGPPRLLATVHAPIGDLRVVNVHPLPAHIERGPYGAPLSFDSPERDAALVRIGQTIAADDAAGRRTLLIGDINTAPTEPEFGRFIGRLSAIDARSSTGFRDAHAEVGLGPGWTYRPSSLERLGIGLIRIDVVLTGPGLRPVAETTTCPVVGDHCAVIATVVADPTASD